jgi:SAM-dependent methyltransferase
MASVHRVLRPGGQILMTVWGNVGKSQGAWMFQPFQWADQDKIQNQANMVSLGRPGVGEASLSDHDFDPEERFEGPFFLEFADPQTYARTLSAMGPSYEAIQDIGLDEFIDRATRLASENVREGLPLRGQIQLFGYVGTKK